nr:HDOD domain-containing protein [Desulfurispira natronophila]
MVANILGNFGIKKTLGDKAGFINVDNSFFLQDFVDLIPKDKLILEILAKTDVDENFLAKMDSYKKSGFLFALGDFEFENWYIERFGPLIKKANFIKIDVQKTSLSRLESKMPILRKLPAKIIAEKVETWDTFEYCRKFGFDFFQGYFYAQPEVLRCEEFTPAKGPILRLIRLLNQSSDVETIAAHFKYQPELSFTLLRYMNSGAMNFTSPIRSIGHAISLLGLKKLKSWLMLMNFAYPESSASVQKKEDSLYENILLRAKLTEELVKRYRDGQYAKVADSAYFVGLLSRAEEALKIPCEEILRNILIPPDMSAAVLKYKGVLGKILYAVICEEKRNHAEMYDILESLGISPVVFDEAMNASHEWLNEKMNQS